MSAVDYVPARARLCLRSLERPGLRVRVQYNPRELQLDQQLRWGDREAGAEQARDEQDEPSRSRWIAIELLFDAHELGRSIEPDLQALEEMASVDRGSHPCLLTWGAAGDGVRPFRCVIESLVVKHTRCDHGGRPVRATCTVRVREAPEPPTPQRDPGVDHGIDELAARRARLVERSGHGLPGA